jgi:FAD synthase
MLKVFKEEFYNSMLEVEILGLVRPQAKFAEFSDFI